MTFLPVININVPCLLMLTILHSVWNVSTKRQKQEARDQHSDSSPLERLLKRKIID